MAIVEEMRINSNLLLPFLPTDITIEILSLLSVESVLSCKRVCKTWRSLIDDIVFAQAHTNRFLLDDDEKQHQQQHKSAETLEFFLFTGDTDFGKYKFGEHTYGDITFKLHKTITHDYPFPVLSLEPMSSNNDCSQRHWLPVSSCNGLICLVSKVEDDGDHNSYICVYNPLTREYVNLPILTYEQPLVRSKHYFLTDFGYHPCTKEYKVVQIHYECIINKMSDAKTRPLGQGQISVYTLGSGSSSGWRSRGKTKFELLGCCGVLLNGAIHWLNFEYFWSRTYMRTEIIAFDLAEEKLRVVPLPPQSLDVYHSALGVLEGRCLCVIVSTWCGGSNMKSCMWVMNQDSGSWTKKCNIALNELGASLFFHRPLAQSKRGKILLHKHNQMIIVSSDLKDTSFDDEDVHVIWLLKKFNALDSPKYEIIPYTKSFVSLKALGEDGARIGRNKGIKMNNHLLPADILDILSRLPVDFSVEACKRVCKMWRDVINEFVSFHYKEWWRRANNG